mgnify:CR=1 FL=1
MPTSRFRKTGAELTELFEVVLDACAGRGNKTSLLAEAVGAVFKEYVEEHGLDAIADAFAKGVRIEGLVPDVRNEQRVLSGGTPR